MRRLDDYSFIRGVCYMWNGDQEQIERELGYAKKLLLNSTRIWLSYHAYWKDPQGFLKKLVNYVRTAYSMGITTMPILWNGNMIDPAILEESYRPTGERFVTDVVNALKDEEGLIMWDIMNEPSCNDYLRKCDGEEKLRRTAQMWDFLHHYCQFVKKIDTVNAITIGHTFVEDLEPTAEDVDVISVHDYLETRARVEATYAKSLAIAGKYNKPLINSELACLCRANPYDMALDICERNHVGWYLFELMVHDYWGDVHGIVYPDGTVRDPSIVAAIYGFHRNRNARTRIRPNPNKEGNAYVGLKMVEDALKDDVTLFLNKRSSSEVILEAAEYCANMLEGCEMVPMIDPPTVAIRAWREKKEEDRDLEAIRTLAYDLAQTVKRYCKIL